MIHKHIYIYIYTVFQDAVCNVYNEFALFSCFLHSQYTHLWRAPCGIFLGCRKPVVFAFFISKCSAMFSNALQSSTPRVAKTFKFSN